MRRTLPARRGSTRGTCTSLFQFVITTFEKTTVTHRHRRQNVLGHLDGVDERLGARRGRSLRDERLQLVGRLRRRSRSVVGRRLRVGGIRGGWRL